MIVHRVEATNLGPFTGAPALAGPFAPGLNILSAPNETGKTTLLRATGRALFDRHTCKDAEIRALRPAGTDLAPQMSVEFETGEGRFRVEKTFLQAPASALHGYSGGDWKLLAEGDEADNRLTRLLQSRHPGRGATNAAHWGLLGYLWMRQGELAEWPEWTGNPAGQLVQSLLVKVEIDRSSRASAAGCGPSTRKISPPPASKRPAAPCVKPRSRSPASRPPLAKLAEERQRLTADEDEYTRLSEGLPHLEAEHARHRRGGGGVAGTARRAEVATEEVQRRQNDLTTAQDGSSPCKRIGTPWTATPASWRPSAVNSPPSKATTPAPSRPPPTGRRSLPTRNGRSKPTTRNSSGSRPPSPARASCRGTGNCVTAPSGWREPWSGARRSGRRSRCSCAPAPKSRRSPPPRLRQLQTLEESIRQRVPRSTPSA